MDADNNGIIDYYAADVITATDYYPFGMDMPGRKFENPSLGGAGGGRYGFNGKERDKDMNSLTAYDYGFRVYNPAIGKFLSVDPLTGSYPELTPYQFASNRPIDGIDLDGLEYFKYWEKVNFKFSFVWLKYTTEEKIVNNVKTTVQTVAGIQFAQGQLNLDNCTKRLANLCTQYDEANFGTWIENGQQFIGTIGGSSTLLGSFANNNFSSEKSSAINSEVPKPKTDAETYATSPVSQYGRGEVPLLVRSGNSTVQTSPVGSKQLGALTAIVAAAQYYAKYKVTLANNEKEEANNKFKEYGWRVLTRIDYAIQNKLIPEAYLNQSTLTELANYFLTGDKPPLLDKKFADDIWTKTDALYYSEQKIVPKIIGNGNSGNTGSKPIQTTETITVYKKI